MAKEIDEELKEFVEDVLQEDNERKLNIGCGWDKMEGFVNIDKSSAVKPDIVVDIEQGLPFADNSFDYIYSCHCLEHIRPQYWSFVLNEISRVAKNECILDLKLPFDNIATRTNCDHYRTFGFMSFDPLLEGSKRDYYSDLTLIKLSKKISLILKLIYNIFPFLRHNINLKFKIIKNEN